ncbi:MAG: methylenetetrahydrofolate reductase [Pseudomonadota bacterium]
MDTPLARLLEGYSIEVLPRTAAKVANFGDILPAGTRVYIAHVPDAQLAPMVATAKRLCSDGLTVMPHFPARAFANVAMLETWIAAYADAGVHEALLIAGGAREPAGALRDAMSLAESGLFERYGFRRLHFAGHPEGNRDIDRDGTGRALTETLAAKQAFADRTAMPVALVTQFVFDAAAVSGWIARLRAAGIRLPVHVGVAGPAKLQTLIKYAALCGVGASAAVLKKRARDVTRLLRPFEPTEVLEDLAAVQAARPVDGVEAVHFFPFGGVAACTAWANARAGLTVS